jgi:hypothetical protein
VDSGAIQFDFGGGRLNKRDLHLQRLRDGLVQMPGFLNRDARKRDPEFDAWRQSMIQSLDVVLPGENYSVRFANLRFQDAGGAYTDYIPDHQKHRALGLQQAELLLKSAIEEAEIGATSLLSTSEQSFIAPSRIAELSAKTPTAFDLRRLIRMCEEVNICYRDECYLAVAMLTRAILDHVPPIFGKGSFAEVANSYGGGQSFKASIQHLENSARNIANSHLHQHIRRKEVLPSKTQISFQQDMDVLLAEIIRIL